MTWGTEAYQDWIRPTDESDCRARMIAAEKARNYQEAALCAIAYADLVSPRAPEAVASFERQAQVYATLYQTDMALWIAENRQPVYPT